MTKIKTVTIQGKVSDRCSAGLYDENDNLLLEHDGYVPEWMPGGGGDNIEFEIDKMQVTLEPLSNFILPGGHSDISICHITRTVCRRAERRVVALSKIAAVQPGIIVYLNRLSDYLFVLARSLAKHHGISEVKWSAHDAN